MGRTSTAALRFWVPEDVPGLEAQQSSHTPRSHFTPHAHDTFSLVHVDEGAQAMRMRGQTVVAAAGRLLAVGAGEMHCGAAADAQAGWSYRILYVAPALLAAAGAEVGVRGERVPDFGATLLSDGALARDFSRTFSALTQPGVPTLEREQQVLALLVQLVARHSATPRSTPARTPCAPGVRRARALLEASVTRNVSLQELARAARLSPWHLVRSFHEQLGQTPQVYLRSLRVREAQRQLAAGAPLADVAAACGFTDQSHLTRQFTRTLGVTPGEYRAAVHGRRVARSGASPG